MKRPCVATATALLLVGWWSPSPAEEMHDVAREGNIKRLQRLLREDPGRASARDKWGRTPLHAVAQRTYARSEKALMNMLTCAKLLIMAGAEVDSKDRSSYTPLHLACQSGNASVAKLLLGHKASLGARTKYGRTPLHCAASGGDLQIMEMLLAKKADVNARDNSGETPLHRTRSGDAVAFLAKKGANVNAKDQTGETPLHTVYSAEAVGVLIDRKANTNARDSMGYTPLHRAVSSGKAEIVEMLLTKGAEHSPEDVGGRTPLTIARQRVEMRKKDQAPDDFDVRRIAELEKCIGALCRHGAE